MYCIIYWMTLICLRTDLHTNKENSSEENMFVQIKASIGKKNIIQQIHFWWGVEASRQGHRPTIRNHQSVTATVDKASH